MSAQTDKIIAATRGWIGTPYRHQASVLGVGCDCLGLIRGVWQEIYGEPAIEIPPYAQFEKDATGAARLLNAAQNYLYEAEAPFGAGQVLLFQLHRKIPPRHCGIIINNSKFIHAQERLGVVEVNLDKRWMRRIHSIYSFPEKV